MLWKQIIGLAKDEQKNIVFVTDDKKEDWWEIVNGKTIGPRPELVKEFKDEANTEIIMYQSNQFMEYAAEYLKEHVSRKSFDEIKVISSLSEKQLERFINHKNEVHNRYVKSSDELAMVKSESKSLHHQIRNAQEDLFNVQNDERYTMSDFNDMKYNIETLEIKLRELRKVKHKLTIDLDVVQRELSELEILSHP